jgi:hypothetical protein
VEENILSKPSFTDEDLVAARDAGLLSEDGYSALNAFLQARRASLLERASPTVPVRFDLTHVLWYAGALIVMAAMGLFSSEAFNRMGGKALTVTAVIYATVFLAIGDFFWRRKGLRTPGGLAVAVAVAMTPIAVYGIEDSIGFWKAALGSQIEYRGFFPTVNARWLYMELATIVAAIIAIRFYPFPFITMVAAIALWFMSMDLAVWLVHADVADFELRRQISLWFGLAIMVSAFIVDLKWRTGVNFAFWLHLAGAATFWGGLTAVYWDDLTLHKFSSEWLVCVYCLINIGLIFFALFIDRQIYAIFGALGIAIYLGHLAYGVFNDALLFSFALSAIGLLIIGLGVAFYQKRETIDRWIDGKLPKSLRAFRPGTWNG